MKKAPRVSRYERKKQLLREVIIECLQFAAIEENKRGTGIIRITVSGTGIN